MGDVTAAVDLISKPLARLLPHKLTFNYFVYCHFLIQHRISSMEMTLMSLRSVGAAATGTAATEADPLGVLWRKANPGNAVFPYLDPMFASGLGFFLHS